jgi:putative hydrolase of the HAD superfamily
MIRHIVFDMGQVLVQFSAGLFSERLRLSAEDAELIRREVLTTVEWVRMDRGTISDDDALARMCARLPQRLHDTAAYLVRRWNDPIVPVPGMADVARDLKAAGYDLYLLSNAATRQHTYWHDIPGSEYFSGTFISADYHLLKPEDAIYQAFFKKFGLKPEECLFIDDSAPNIEASENAGMAGIVFHGDAARLRRQLAERGIL